MAKVPPSFFKLQALLVESSTMTEVGDEVSNSVPTGSSNPSAAPVSSKEKSLSFLCDNVLASLHAEEDFRDAVIDSRANVPEGCILLLINSEFEKLDELKSYIASLEHVAGIGSGEREDPTTKEKITVVKIQGRGEDCNPKDEDGKPKAPTTVGQPVSA